MGVVVGRAGAFGRGLGGIGWAGSDGREREAGGARRWSAERWPSGGVSRGIGWAGPADGEVRLEGWRGWTGRCEAAPCARLGSIRAESKIGIWNKEEVLEPLHWIFTMDLCKPFSRIVHLTNVGTF